MSEPVSAFSAYNSSFKKSKIKSEGSTKSKKIKSESEDGLKFGSKTTCGTANGAQSKGAVSKSVTKTKKEPADKQTGVATKFVQKNTTCGTAKAKPTNPAKPNAVKPKAEPKVNGGRSKSNAGTAKAKGTTSKVGSSSKSRGGRKSNDYEFNEDEIEDLVEELMQSPSKKKLTKEEQRRKKAFEDYLVQKLEEDDGMDGDEGEEDGYGDGSDEDEFSDEYTLSGSDSCSCSACAEEEEESYSEGATGSDDFNGSYSETGSDNFDESYEDCMSRSNARSKPARNCGTNKRSCSTNPRSCGTNPRSCGTNKRSCSTNKRSCSTNKRSCSTNMRNCDSAGSSCGSSKPKAAKNDVILTRQEHAATNNSLSNGSVSQTPKRVVETETVQAATAATATGENVSRRSLKLEPLSPPSNVAKMDSISEGLKVFRWLLNPLQINDFYGKYWESNVCLVKRQQSNYYSHLISFEAIDQMLLQHYVEFTKNIDVTSYKTGVRETLNPEGRALPPTLWECYGNGCSIRLLNPQTFLPAMHTLNATLQEYFHCMVGANVYLTPPNSQGFAPHYDDIEAFVLQIEGRKRWKLYRPRNKSEELPRTSSHNFQQHEIGEPIMEEVLSAGDILYFPRGTIHQACTEPGQHSLHITLSVYQKQSYADLFECMMPLILQRAVDSSVSMRRGLPLNTWQNAGIAFSGRDTEERQQVLDNVSQLLTQCIRDTNVAEVMDAAVDQLAKKFQREALPPVVLPSERARTIFGSKSKVDANGECICDYEIDLRTNVRLLRANIMRLVREEQQKLRIYYYLHNSREYCQYEPNFIEINADEAASVEVLIKSYPAYVGVAQLPLSDDERKISMVTALWECGLLMLEKPLHDF